MLARLGLRGGLSAPFAAGLLEAPARGKSFTEVAKVRLPLRFAFPLPPLLLEGASVI
jgi:hypothetical protein